MKSLNLNKQSSRQPDLLNKTQMKKILGGDESLADCTASTDCPNGGSISCSGKTPTPDRGEACQKVEGLFVDCYTGTSWSYTRC